MSALSAIAGAPVQKTGNPLHGWSCYRITDAPKNRDSQIGHKIRMPYLFLLVIQYSCTVAVMFNS